MSWKKQKMMMIGSCLSNFIEQNTTSDPSVLSLLIVRSSKKPDILKDESQKLINHFLFVKKKTLFYQ